jgi:predicted Zn finger-like uncharacterized protein
MILTCPNCGTQYVVKDGAIPPQGRQVRCASCKHSWHQDPETVSELELGAQADDGPSADEESFAEAAIIDPSSGPEAEERAYEEALIDNEIAAEPIDAEPRERAMDAPDGGDAEPELAPAADYRAPPELEAQPDDFSPFAERERVEPRGRGRVLGVILALVLIAAIAAALWFLAPPEWKARLGLADATETPLQLMISHPDRQPLASGNELLTVTGRVINPTDKTHPVPPIYAQLKSPTGKVIYSWTIQPPAPALGPGESASFNSAEVNVPAGGEDLTITLGSAKS